MPNRRFDRGGVLGRGNFDTELSPQFAHGDCRSGIAVGALVHTGRSHGYGGSRGICLDGSRGDD